MASADGFIDGLGKFIASHPEWLIEHHDTGLFSALADEIRFHFSDGLTRMTVPSHLGMRELAVAGVHKGEASLELEVFRPEDGVLEVLRLVKRTGYSELTAESEKARAARAGGIAAAFRRSVGRARIVRVSLTEAGGRIAEIVCEDASARQYVAIADVSETIPAEALLSCGLLRLKKLSARRRNPTSRITLVASVRQAERLRRLTAMLSPRYGDGLDVCAIEESFGECEFDLREMVGMRLCEALSVKTARGVPAEDLPLSPTAEAIRNMSPEQIDIVRSAHGETLRFNGLPFARVRVLGGKESVWCGVGRGRLVGTDEFMTVFEEQISELAEKRSADATDRRHEYFRLAPEAWLESLIRRDVGLLDPNLILSPVHRQFRAASGRIDLLALRSDGTLVVIELKVSPDRDMAFQAAEYWRGIEGARRAGVFGECDFFGGAEVADRPAAVYLVAPTLSFHADVGFLASALHPDIPVCRFELNEDWRRTLKVSRRLRLRA